jgi:formamidopyrimidine-DNA glycosylase
LDEALADFVDDEGAFVNEAGVNLEKAGAGGEFLARIGGGEDAADADDGDATAGKAMDGADDFRAARGEGPSAGAAFLLHAEAALVDGGVGGDEAGEAEFFDGLGDGFELGFVEIGGDLEEERTAAFRVVVAERAEDGIEEGALLELAQAGGIGGADVDDEVVGEIERAAETGEVIAAGVGEGSVLVLAEVEADGGDGPAAGGLHFFKAAGDFLDADVGEAETIDEALFARQAEDAGRRVTGLRAGGDGAEFHEAEAEPGPDGDALGVLVEAGGEADGIGEGEAEEFGFEGGERTSGEGLEEGGRGGVGERGEGGVVHRLGREGEEERADDAAVEHGRRDFIGWGRICHPRRLWQVGRMPELAEVDYFRKQWNPGLGQRIEEVLIHPKARLFRGTDLKGLARGLTGATLERSEARGKQMLFVAKPKKARAEAHAWLGVHLGMTGQLRVEPAGFAPAKHDHLALRQAKQTLVFRDARLFGRILFAEGKELPAWWAKLAPDLLSGEFTVKALGAFLKRRAKAPIKAVLLMQERFPGIGNWMADEILWRAAIHPQQAAGTLDAKMVADLHREIRAVCRGALKIIGTNWDDPPDSWLFGHRWAKGGTCPRTGGKLMHATIGGRTTCWSPERQKLVAI